ncbi:transient receptor potential cation channel subfamily a member 1 [Plakobranchus ocellatus]|uniref:Transient receptor potential cation channel subfamily a member 1 n=1 Tax=Plakobranchus ocellatus TaxID=259542 RepID=A0AAV4C1L6_9GAST|nr:transient receptor potential cation channel subfamily a member 1 [Plakobranchus ocellatus]
MENIGSTSSGSDTRQEDLVSEENDHEQDEIQCKVKESRSGFHLSHSKSTSMMLEILMDSMSPEQMVKELRALTEVLMLCAQNGNAKEVARILRTDPTRLHARNAQGQMALHVAASKGKKDVVAVIVEQDGVDLDALDQKNNTALLLAVEAQSPEIVDLLIKSGADVNIANSSHQKPIHLAAELSSIEVVKALLDNGVDPNTRGDMGMSPLHYAAGKDNGEIMRLLMACGGKPCGKCDFGYYPIHIAAKCSAANAMEAIIEEALKFGYTREQILSFKDRENNLPLHAAVNGGDIKAVEVCLKAGASVKTPQDDGSTPVHFACAQGNMEMIRMMEQTQPENFQEALFTVDVMKMAPIHRAALFNHVAVLKYLLEHGADVDCRDVQDRTPLLLAASKGCWGAVQLLIANNADVHVKDTNNRNFLHLAIRFGGKLDQIGGDFIKDIKNLLNERDDFGCSPLHYASKEGHLLALDDLIRMGAVLNPKNNQKQSPFHFAARYGRYNTCRRLLDSMYGPNIINETDGSGLTALHIAAQNGHTKVIQLLLQRGAVVNKDNEDNTPLHHAASEGWTHSMRVLIGVKSNLLNSVNADGETALHIAAKNGQTSATTLLLTLGATFLKNNQGETFFDHVIQSKHSEVAVATVNHERWQEVLMTPSSVYGWFMLGLIEHLPDVCSNVLDRCQTTSDDDPRSPQYHINYNFRFLDTPVSCLQAVRKKQEDSNVLPMMALNAMVKNNRVNCLSHPVCTTFLKVKWTKYGMPVYMAYLIVYGMFLASITSFVCEHNAMNHYDKKVTSNETIAFLHGNKSSGYRFTPCFIVALWFIAAYSAANILKEILQIITQKRKYFQDFGNAVEWSLYVSSLLFVVPFLGGFSCHWQWEIGAIAVFLSWFNALVFLQRFDFFGIYVVMFIEILRTLIQVLCVFSILIIAFGLSFYMLLYKEESKAYSTPQLSLLRTFMMMLELDYMASFNAQFVDGHADTLHFGSLTLVMLVIFVLFMPILLVNLLIGLAVGDIESVQRDARLKRLAMQVELHTSMESKMPMFIYKRVTMNEYKHYPNTCAKRLDTFMTSLAGSNKNMEPLPDPTLNPNSILYEELYKQKVRMRDMNSMLERNNELLRKIMQKMEIHTEDDAWDEGVSYNCDVNVSCEDNYDEVMRMQNNSNRFKSKSFKEKMYLKSAVVAMWQKQPKP